MLAGAKKERLVVLTNIRNNFLFVCVIILFSVAVGMFGPISMLEFKPLTLEVC